eukprot:TRINITY_DN1578_c0_g2_i2.p1 TRINITY_DN1578_c0_g2~~TRINITY_DN1578_c0_g2_i2.p1  ORF type:complete len:665 (-),score=233.61 TRINITY_DN1578_c0_g2_i2:220-2214(-)
MSGSSERKEEKVAPSHPLDPLDMTEVNLAASIIRNDERFLPNMKFIKVTLEEPNKNEMLQWHAAEVKPQIDRQAFIVLYQRGDRKTWEVVVSLTQGRVLKMEHVPGKQPPFIMDEYNRVETLVRTNPVVQQALIRRGITQFENVMVDAWAIGHYSPDDAPTRRLTRPLLFYFTPLAAHPGIMNNGYGRPIDGLEVTIDLDEMRVVKVEESNPVPPLPPYDPVAEFSPPIVNEYRKDLKPLYVQQPEGVSFTVKGRVVEWQNWRFHVGFNMWEGLVLNMIEFFDKDKNKYRPILYRASIAEMIVPYACPNVPNYRKNAFDAGEDGLGRSANQLQMGCNCLGSIYYFDFTQVTPDGQAQLIPSTVCMHEEDYGILWKHVNWRNNDTDVRRSRRLVVSFITTIQNYEYGFFWYFYLDGGIQMEVKLTGILSVSAIPDGQSPHPLGIMIAPNLFAPIHQHLFTARLDMMVDGTQNEVVQASVIPAPPGSRNPHKSSFHMKEEVLKNESDPRDVDPVLARHWIVQNRRSKNRMGNTCGFKLVPETSVQFMAQEGSSIHRRANWMTRHLWVTPFHPDEKYPGGPYPNQNPGPDGLAVWTRQRRDVEDKDVVLWYNFGVTHIPRAEDWPIMPCEYVGFKLKPVNFFDYNPTLDVPPDAENTKIILSKASKL